MLRSVTLGALLAILALPAAADTTALTPAQKTEVEALVRELLTTKEPDLVIKAITTYQMQEKAAREQTSQQAVGKHKDRLLNDATSPVLGNPKGDVTIVEFFDYQCGYCKMAHPHMKQMISEDKGLRYIAKELPILGPGSELASRAALASIKQKKYEEFHNALMEQRAQITEAAIDSIAEKLKLDVAKLKKDMNDKSVSDIIAANRQLAADLDVRGTPMFIIGNKTFPGAMDATEMKAAIAAERNNAKQN